MRASKHRQAGRQTDRYTDPILSTVPGERSNITHRPINGVYDKIMNHHGMDL